MTDTGAHLARNAEVPIAEDSPETRISVITPFLNARSFLKQSAMSVESQTHSNWELILIDDGSTDGSSEIARTLSERSSRVRYLEHPGHANLGKSTSRNLGIRCATGKYVCFLDADDVFLPTKLQHQLGILLAHRNVQMVYGNTQYWYDWADNAEAENFVPRMTIDLDRCFCPPELLPVLIGQKGAMPCICSLLAERKEILRLGGFEEGIQNLYEDQVFLAKFFVNSSVYVDGTWQEKYRQVSDSDWHRSMAGGQDQEARLMYLRWLDQYVRLQPRVSTQMKRKVRRALRRHRVRSLPLAKGLTRMLRPPHREKIST